MYRVHTLPTTPTKDTEEELKDKDENRPFRSVADSLVLLQALRQSRQTWLTSAFNKFSTKTRGAKGSDIWQPPHTIRFRGKCDLEIGPHVFYATSVYEVIYQSYSVPVPIVPPQNVQNTGLPPGSAVQPSASDASSTPPSGIGGSIYSPSATALISSLKGAVPVTADLIAQVNAAAASNPTLANLLGLAASGSATPEQLQTLGVTIQSLADTAFKSAPPSGQSQTTSSGSAVVSKTPSTASINSSGQTLATIPPSNRHAGPPVTSQGPVLSLRPSQPSSTNGVPGQIPAPQQVSQTMQVIHKDPDVVIEFYENSYDRWVLPKDLVLYERVKRWDGNSSLADIIFSTIFPFEGPKPIMATPSVETPVLKDVHPITLRFFNVPPTIWNLFSQAAGDEERTKRVKLAMDTQLDKAASREYLQYRISDGTFLTQLQASASDRYPTKAIRPTYSAGNAGTTHGKRRASANAKTKNGSMAGGPPPKRKRTVQVNKSESRTGTCDICKRASVVLASGGPYCPPCAKKVGFTSTTATNNPSNVISPVGSGSAAQPQGNSSNVTSLTAQAAAATGTSDPKTPMQPAASATSKESSPSIRHPPSSQTSSQQYYAWQGQPYYHPQPGLNPSPQTHNSVQPSSTVSTSQTKTAPSDPKNG